MPSLEVAPTTLATTFVLRMTFKRDLASQDKSAR